MALEQRVASLEADLVESRNRLIEAIDSLRSEMREGFSGLRVGQNPMAEALIVLIDPRDVAYTPVRQDLTKRLRSHFEVSEER